MFFKLILENANGDRVDMTATANQYMTSRVEGLNPPTGTISTSSYAGMDGSYLNNAFIEKRNVVISFEMRGVGVEARRHQLYKVAKPSRYIKIYYATAGIDVFAEGYVESCEVQNFEMLTTGQISILCPDIYWYSTTSVMAYLWQEPDTDRLLCRMQAAGVHTYAAVIDPDARELRSCDFNGSAAVMIGNEGNGIPAQLADACDTRLTIRMQGHINSLNAAMAAGIILWELQGGQV